MTVIIGYGHEGKSYIASDSKCSDDITGQFYKNKKVFRKGSVLVGVAGSVRQSQLVLHNFKEPKRLDGQTTEYYMYQKFFPTIVQFLVDNYCIKEDEGLANPEADYIFVLDGVVFKMENSALFEPETPYDCIGEGGMYAHAIMTTCDTLGEDIPIKAKLEMAVYLTSRYILSVGGKAVVLSE